MYTNTETTKSLRPDGPVCADCGSLATRRHVIFGRKELPTTATYCDECSRPALETSAKSDHYYSGYSEPIK